MTKNNKKIIELLNSINNYNSSINCDGFALNGEFVGLDKSLYSILRHIDSILYNNERLQEENIRLKDEHYKDEELKKANDECEKMRKDLMRGFPISEEEAEKIREWKENHLRKKHPRALKDPSYFGCIGGNFTYSFIPTSIGVVGYVQCSCGEQFEFTGEL